MHFIGMIAYETSMAVAYDPLLTFVSLIIAVSFVGIGIVILGRNQDSIALLLIAGVITGLGVASMHYSGMAAMIMPAKMHYDSTLVIVSIVIALVAATTALWLAFNLDGTLQMMIASVVMGIAVCGMHYTGMAAMSMTPIENAPAVSAGIQPLTLGLFIFCFSMLLLILSLIVTMSQLQKRMYEELEEEEQSNFGSVHGVLVSPSDQLLQYWAMISISALCS